MSEEAGRAWYDHKSKLMEEMLGREHGSVMHAIIPFEVGGALDLYYYPNGIDGTAIATKELCELPGEGPSNRDFENYELVMFTKQKLDLDQAQDENSAFGKTHAAISRFLNFVARYADQAELNPRETCEFPEDFEALGGRCLIFDAYQSKKGEFGLMLLIEVFRSEMDFARKNGGQKLIEKLKKAGVYPYSDLDRKPVA